MGHFSKSRMKGMLRKSIFFRQILFLLIGTIILFSILNSLSFLFIASDMFKNLQIRELKARSVEIINIVLKYQEGIITKDELHKEFEMNDVIWKAVVYVYDSQGNIEIKNQGFLDHGDHNKDDKIKQEIENDIQRTFGEHLNSVLQGREVTSTKGPVCLVGEPIINQGAISGGVFLMKPPEELRAAMFGLSRSIMISALCVFLLMIFPVYNITGYIVKPLRQMRDVAIHMANGILTEKADERSKGELGELSHSLNYLSSRLSKTISDLELERNRLKQTIDGLSEGIVAIDFTGRITHVNPAIYNIFGESQEDGRRGVIPDQELWKDFDLVLLQGHTIIRNMYWKKVYLRITICPLEDEDRRIVGAVGLFLDVTESERLEQTRREYVANVSHELRTPVSALRALSETLVDDMVTDEETKKRYYNHMLQETMRLTRLINDLLTLSRLQSNADAIQWESFTINPIIQNVVERYTLLAHEKGIQFSFSLLKEDMKVHSNADLVEQVLIILLDNGIKYTAPNGSISVYAFYEDKHIKISVADTGIGIDEEDLPHVFERFYKSDKAHSTEGTGLGLAIASEIVKKLEEQIYVESEIKKGSTFTFTLSPR